MARQIKHTRFSVQHKLRRLTVKRDRMIEELFRAARFNEVDRRFERIGEPSQAIQTQHDHPQSAPSPL